MKSKKLISIIISLCMAVTGIMCCMGCDGEKPYVDTSNAAVPGQFDNPETAKAKEAEDDAAGREHIEIPEGAETIEIDGEIYYPIDSLDIDSYTYGSDYLSKNYILTGDVDITDRKEYIGFLNNYYTSIVGLDIPFTGKFNGNNYKIYGKRNRMLFDYIDGAEISNFVLSSELVTDGDNENAEVLFCAQAYNSTIKNIVNYSSMDNSQGLIYFAVQCEIDKITNHGDGINMRGTLVRGMQACVVKNCKNYGNFSNNVRDAQRFGAIVGIIWHYGEFKSLVESCENYGNLIGTEYVGGIVGRMIYNGDKISSVIMQNPSIISDCANYGDIYRNKNSTYTVFNDIEGRDFYYIGGIAGNGPKIENCINNGHIYGFESINPQFSVDYIGGIAGSAIEVENCNNQQELNVSSQVRHVDEICGFIIRK